ncbi:UNVERIFIED_CONTAM: hypothetical protein FKN15_042044 [Acipenser sinensis]
MQDKMADLEDRNRHNVRLEGLPEEAEGDDPIHFLQQKIPHWYLTLKSSSDHPFLELEHILYMQAARKSAPVIVQGQMFSFYVDYSAVTTTKKRAFGEVRSKLRFQGVNNFLGYPAILKVNHGGERLSFTNPEEVDSFLALCFQDMTGSVDPSV